MDRKRHFREDLMKELYPSRKEIKTGRLAARVDDLRAKGYQVESPLVRYINGKKVQVTTKGKKPFNDEFWYMLKGSKTVWKSIENEWAGRVKKNRSRAAKKAAKTLKVRKIEQF